MKCKKCGSRTIKKRWYCEACRKDRKSWINPVMLQCEGCLQLFSRPKGSVERGRTRFCSIKCYRQNLSGKGNPNWKGGIKPIEERIRNSKEMRDWIRRIMKKDEYTCVLCGQVGGKLHVHHIFPFHGIVESYRRLHGTLDYEGFIKEDTLWNEFNGVTLCENCHSKFPNRIGDDDSLFLPMKFYERFLKGAQKVVIIASPEEWNEQGVVQS